MSEAKQTLLPCPFCGNEAEISESDDDMPRWVWCPGCEADGPPIDYRFNGPKEEALSIVAGAWNTRIVDGHSVTFHWEPAGVVAPTPVWVVFHSGYMYGPYERWQDVEKAIRDEWKHDRNMVG